MPLALFLLLYISPQPTSKAAYRRLSNGYAYKQGYSLAVKAL